MLNHLNPPESLFECIKHDQMQLQSFITFAIQFSSDVLLPQFLFSQLWALFLFHFFLNSETKEESFLWYVTNKCSLSSFERSSMLFFLDIMPLVPFFSCFSLVFPYFWSIWLFWSTSGTFLRV